MGVEENKATVQMFYDEVLNRGNLDVIDKMTAENYVDHTAPPGMSPGREGEKQWFALLRAAFPDGQTTIEDIIAEGDKVVVRATMTGTHQGDFMGIPATGKQVTISGIDVTRFHEGQSVEHWGQWDMAALMQQLGVAPPPPPQAATSEEPETPGEPENE
ncbi:MAG TPA: ester cyclase [Thermoplasmata archaeon]|nr:ester cyclase [Thermoplasmata archaeon]